MKRLFFYLSLIVFLFQASIMYGQKTISVRGKVIAEEDGNAIVGASVLVQGTRIGTITDMEGEFQIPSVPVTAKNLEITFVGMEKKIVPIKQGIINVTLKTDSKMIEEVVVTALGKTRSADKLGSTASVVSTDKIMKAGDPTLINSLAGKAAGVRISSPNGEAGSGSNIIIRGANTFIGNSQPLIILDGIPISNDYYTGNESTNVTQQSRLNDINPSDIESLQILKGASAAALWGSRAANGVIVITTKNGKNNAKPNITYSYSKSIDWISFRHPIQSTYGQGTGGKWNKNTNLSWGDKISDRSGEADAVDKSGAYFVADSGNIYYPVLQKNSRETYTDSNFDAIYGTGGFDQHELALSGGNDRSNYYLSYGGLFQDGIIKNSDYKKHNIRLNSNYRFAD